MAREQHYREDLMAEATALVERAELVVPGRAEHVVAGFRRDGCASFFFGPDEVYQFNARCQLRRAYRDDRPYKAAGGRLIELDRQRTADEVQFVRRDLDAAETAAFLLRMREAIGSLLEALREGRVKVVARVPPDADVPGRLLSSGDVYLAGHIASAPNAR